MTLEPGPAGGLDELDLELAGLGRRRIDLGRAEAAARELLVALGEDADGERLRETPRRVAEAFAELLTPDPFQATSFANEGRYDELVLVRGIPFHTLCEHHLLPFQGQAHLAYLPGERIVGLSKLARVVEVHARRLQLQERLTTEIADWLERELDPKGVGVLVEAEHLCMSIRGIQKPGTRTVTSALRGLVKDDPRTRGEFLALAGARQ
jgi:GTP cyclohydrolase IA